MSQIALFHGLPENLEQTAGYVTPVALAATAVLPGLPIWLRAATGTLAVLEAWKRFK